MDDKTAKQHNTIQKMSPKQIIFRRNLMIIGLASSKGSIKISWKCGADKYLLSHGVHEKCPNLQMGRGTRWNNTLCTRQKIAEGIRETL